MRKNVEFYLNGKKISAGANQSRMMLAEYLRQEKGLTGTKIVCAEGDCGSCSILKYYPHNDFGKSYFIPINSCITTVAQMDASSLITVEALEEAGQLNEIQESLLLSHGSQCGFCTPGFVMALAGLAEKKINQSSKKISEQDVKNAFTGNLCRCTGYKHIIDAGTKLTLDKVNSLKDRYYNSSQEKDLNQIYKNSLNIEGEDYSFYAPKTLSEATTYLNDHPETKIISATTDLGVLHNKRRFKIQKVMSLHLVDELYEIKKENGKVYLGSRVTIEALRSFIKSDVSALSKYLDIFASPQIKNTATIIGNIANASPIGDTPPALMALNTVLHVQNKKGTKNISLNNFYQGYKQTMLEAGDIITGLTFDIPTKNQDFFAFKNSNRKDLDISCVNMAFLIDWKNKKTHEIEKINISCGGVAATVLELKKTQSFLVGKAVDQKTVDQALEIFHTEFTPISDVRSTNSYRHIVLDHYFRRCFSEISKGAQ